jgi:hypothetical protein
MAEAAPAMRFQDDPFADSNQQSTHADAVLAVTDDDNIQDDDDVQNDGNDSDDDMIDPIEVYNGLQNQLESIEVDLATS